MSHDDGASGADPASSPLLSERQLTIRTALIEAITRKLEYVEWTPEDLRGRVEVSMDKSGVKTYWLDKTAVLQIRWQTIRWLLPAI